jgi:acetoin utilization deacetylase AcuC-like enzyme
VTQKKTGYVFDRRYLDHDTGLALVSASMPANSVWDPQPHVASPALVARVDGLLHRSGVAAELEHIPARMATVKEVAAVHSREYIDHVRQVSENGGGEVGAYSPASRETYEVALLSCGGALAAVDEVVEGKVENAYALLRPPGHHAMPDEAMGFCFFNNVAIAARYAISRLGLERVAILDWDVHHGNGTQTAFYHSDDVLYISLHEDDWYPTGWGRPGHTGDGDGEGFTVNVPLPAGTGDAGYLRALDRVVAPVLQGFRPDLILISAGQDASALDPVGHMVVTSDGFRAMTLRLKAVASEVCDGRLVMLHEGGYSEGYSPVCTWAIIEELSEVRSGLEDPYREWLCGQPATHYVGVAEGYLDAVVTEHRQRWDLT